VEGLVTEWLPRQAFSKDAVAAALADWLADWSARWFTRAQAAVTAVRAGDGDPPSLAPDWFSVHGAHAALAMSARGKRYLLEAALAVELAEHELRVGDRLLLDSLAEEIVRDIVAVLDDAAGLGESRGGQQLLIAVAIESNAILELIVPASLLVPKLKARMARSQTSGRLAQRIDALRSTRLVVQARLGRAEFPINELRGLSVGDVVVMDHALSDPIDLCLAGQDVALARGRLCRSGTQVSIQL
jgi:flagellar motor switch/type III secretory pathway protein FliN